MWTQCLVNSRYLMSSKINVDGLEEGRWRQEHPREPVYKAEILGPGKGWCSLKQVLRSIERHSLLFGRATPCQAKLHVSGIRGSLSNLVPLYRGLPAQPTPVSCVVPQLHFEVIGKAYFPCQASGSVCSQERLSRNLKKPKPWREILTVNRHLPMDDKNQKPQFLCLWKEM